MVWLRTIKAWVDQHRMGILGFSVASAYWPGLLSAAWVPRWAVIAIGLPLASRLDPRAVPEGLRWLLLWLLATALIATTWASPDRMGGYLELFFMTLLCLAFVAGAALESLDDVMIGLGYGVVISSLGALVKLALAAGDGPAPVGLFFNSEVFAEFAALVLVWAVLRKQIGIAVMCAMPLALCESRVALLAAACGLLYAFGPRSKAKMAMCLVVLLSASAAMLFAFGLHKAGTADHRLVLWTATIYSWTQFGHGLGWFATTHPASEFAHSDALQAIAELGIGGFALWLIPIFAFNSRRGSNAERATFVAVCVEVAVSFPLHFPASGFLAAMLAGYLACSGVPLRLGQPHGRDENGRRIRWREAAGFPASSGSRSGGETLPVRPGAAWRARLRDPESRFDPQPNGY
jgi:hypothetical protein